MANVKGAIDIDKARNVGVAIYTIYSENNQLSPSCKAIAGGLRAAGYSILVVNDCVSNQGGGSVQAIERFCDAYVQKESRAAGTLVHGWRPFTLSRTSPRRTASFG